MNDSLADTQAVVAGGRAAEAHGSRRCAGSGRGRRGQQCLTWLGVRCCVHLR